MTRSARQFGIVAIGRNEGERLRACLQSAAASRAPLVYVDSGSSDESVAMARGLGCETIELDPTIPFTAARARNEGFERLSALAPDLGYVQFVDGDCEIAPDWLETAAAFLDAHPDFGAVCGRRRERHPEQTLYNMVCDIDLDRPAGETRACGGDVMIRVEAFRSISGYRAALIAGEDPELCVRMRAAGWRIRRLNAKMTLHDAAMTRFRQWWMRAVRTGYAYAQGAYLHGAAPERHCVRQSRSAWFWGLGLPLAAIAAVLWFGPSGLALLLAYPFQVARLARRGLRTQRENWWYAFFLVLGKLAETVGQVKFLVHRAGGARSRLIEYK